MYILQSWDPIANIFPSGENLIWLIYFLDIFLQYLGFIWLSKIFTEPSLQPITIKLLAEAKHLPFTLSGKNFYLVYIFNGFNF